MTKTEPQVHVVRAVRRGPTVASSDGAHRHRAMLRIMSHAMVTARLTSMGINRAYEDLLADVLENGTRKTDRTGTGTLSVFGRQIRYDLAEGFPRITTVL